MGPRELLAAYEILSLEGRVSKKIEFRSGPNFKQIRHVGDGTTVMFVKLNGKTYISLRWITNGYIPYPYKLLIKKKDAVFASNGKTTYIQLALSEAIPILA